MRIIDHLTTEPEFKKYQRMLANVPSEKQALRRWPELSGEPSILNVPILRVWYFMLRLNGQGHKFAAMLVLQRSPRIMTDSVFFEGQGDLAKQLQTETHLNLIVGNAKKHGYNPNRHDIYNPNLARFPGDPEAFVPATGGRGYIKQLCEKRGWACEGAVNVSARQDDPGPDKQLGDNIAIEAAMDMAKRNPELRRVDKRDLVAEARLKHGKKKNPLKA